MHPITVKDTAKDVAAGTHDGYCKFRYALDEQQKQECIKRSKEFADKAVDTAVNLGQNGVEEGKKAVGNLVGKALEGPINDFLISL